MYVACKTVELVALTHRRNKKEARYILENFCGFAEKAGFAEKLRHFDHVSSIFRVIYEKEY
jgi:hypothetical protein